MNRAVALTIIVGGLLGLLAIAFLWAIPHMEDDLTERAASRLSEQGVEGAAVEFDGRDGTVSGPDADDARIAIDDLRGARSLAVGQDAAAEPTASSTPSTTSAPIRATTSTIVASPPAPATPTTMPKPIEVTVERSGQSIVFSGSVGTDADRDRLVNEAVATGYAIDDRLVIDDAIDRSGRVPKAAAGLIMALFVGADDAVLRLRGDDVEVSGTANDPVEAEVIADAIAAARGRGLTIEASVAVRELSEDEQVVALQSEIDQIFELSRIIGQETPGFGYSSDELNDSAISILDRVIVAMQRYPLPGAVVEGHTDSRGSSTSNVELSIARAQTVVDHLIAGGADPERLTISGRGESDPIADNGSEIGRLENRRVNFIVGKRGS